MVPVVVVFCNTILVTRHNSSLVAVVLAVQLRVICSWGQMPTIKTYDDDYEQFEQELWSVFRQQLGWNFVRDSPVIHKNSHCFCRGNYSDRNGGGQFCISVCNDKYELNASICLGQWIQHVHRHKHERASDRKQT